MKYIIAALVAVALSGCAVNVITINDSVIRAVASK
jgi:hypothetical protein